jgi:hypothetical protein
VKNQPRLRYAIPDRHFLGATGAGKPCLSGARGIAACRRSYSVKHIRLPDILNELSETWIYFHGQVDLFYRNIQPVRMGLRRRVLAEIYHMPWTS